MTSDPRLVPALDRTMLIAALVTPLLLLHAHGFAEASVGIAGVCFLIRSGVTRDWAWLRTTWVWLSLVWWGWMVFCSLPIPALGLGDGGTHSLVQGLAAVRFPVFVAALEFGVLRDPAVRRWMFGIILASTVYMAVHVVIQFAFGRSLYGVRPLGGALLTGPFGSARVAPPLARLLLPAMLPLAARFLDRPGPRQIWAYAVLLGGMCALVMIGARVPIVLAGGGLAVAAVLLPRMRPMALVAATAAVLLIGSLPIVSPLTYQRLVTQTMSLMSGFATTQYGQLYARATEIGVQRPLTGLGFDGFRRGCEQPRYFRPSFDFTQADGGGAAICWVHPHNFYLQALVDGGVIGLVLFCAVGVVWLITLARGLWRSPDPVRVGLFATILAQLFPVQSTSSYWGMPMGGWFYLLLGWALAEARWRAPER